MSAKKRKGGLALDAICAKLKTQRLQVDDSPEEAASPEDATDVAPQVSEEDVHVNGVASPIPLVDQDTCQDDNNEESNSRTDDSLDHRQSSLDSQQDCAMQDSKDDNLPIGNDSVPELASPSDDVAPPQDEQPEDLSVTNDQKLDLANDKNEQRPEESSRRKRTPNKITHFQMEEELSDDGIDGDVVIVQPTGCSDSEDEIDETTEFENPFNQSDNEDQDDEDYDPEKDNINKRASSTARPEPQVATPVVNTSHKATAESKPEQTPPSEPHVSQGDASTLRDYAESTMNELIGMFGYDSSDHDLKALPLQTFSSGKILEMQIKERQGNGLQNEALALVQGLTGATIDGRGSKYDFFIQKLKSGENFADPNDTITAGTISPRRSSKFDPERIKYLQPQDISPILANLNEPMKKGGRPLKYDVRNFQGFNANASPQTVTTAMTTSDLQHSNNNSGDADLFDGELARTANASTDYIKACFSENGKPDVEEMLRNNEMNIFQKYIAKFSANVHCGHLHCMYQYKEHFHCLDTECNYQRYTNKQDVIRHYNMHKKKDNSLQHGFMRFSPLDDCSVYYSGCSLNLKHTHYHCMQVGCNKVYTSTSDVMTHENFHKKNAAFISEGFQRFRATEDCGIITCSFYGQKTTHFHCRRPNCNFSFKNKCDIEKHKAYHVKDDMYTKEGFKKFYKYEECRFDGCVYSKASNHFHCIRPGCGFTFTSTGQMHSHRRKHERRELRNLRDNKYTPGVHRMKLNQLIQQQQQLQLLQQQQQQQLQQQTLPIQIQVPQAAPAPVSLPPPTPLITTTAATDPSNPTPAAIQAAKLAKMPEATDVQEAKSGPVISASLARMAAAALSPSSKLAAASPTPSNSLPQLTVPNEEALGQVNIKKEKESEEDECESSGGSLKLHIKQEDTSSQLMSMDGVDLSDSLNLTANFATLANPRASAAPEMDLGSSLNLNLPGVEEGDNARSLDTWEKFLKRYTANDPCDPRCEFLYKDHYHCVVEGCGAIFRSKEGVNKHAKYHRLSEGMIQNGFERFSQSQDCQKYDPNCQLRLKESHYHCTWPGCTHAVQMLTPNNQHYEQHKMMITPPSEIKPVPGSSLSCLPSGSQVDGIPGMRRFTLQENCGYPECYYSMKSSHYHCTKDGCLLAYVQAHAAANHPNMHDNSNSPVSEHSLTPSPEGLQFFNKYHNAKDFFCYYGIKRLCPDQQCEYRLRGHYHCNKPGCHFTTVGTSKLPWHLKKHDKAEQREAQGYKFFTKRESCGRLGCKYSLKSSHFHCIRPGCKFNFQFKHQMVTHSRKHMRRLFGRNFEQVLKANGEAAMESVISNTPPGQPPQNAVSSLILKKPLLQSSASSSAATPVPILPMTSLPQTILLSPPANPMQVALTSPPHVLTTGAAAQMAFPVNLTVNTPNITQAAAASPTISTQAGEAIPMASTPLAIPQLAIISQAPSLAGTSLPTLMVTQPTTTLAGLGQPQLLSHVQQTQQMQVAHALQLAQQIQKAGLVTPTLLAQQVQTVAQPTLTSPNSMSPSPLFSSFSVPLTPLDSESSQPPSAPNTPGGSNDSTSNDSGTLHQLPTNRNPFSSFEFRVKKRRSRMIDDGTMLEGFARYDLYEDCKDPKCQFSMRVTHYHCTRPNCGYKFCGRTHMYKHSQHHDRVDSLVLDDFQRFKSSVSCGRDSCLFSEKSTHFHCLRCDFQCTDSTKVTAHRKHHSKSDTVQAAGFRQFGSGVSCEQDGCRYNMKCSHFHCMHDGCRHVVVGMSQMESHKRKHTKHSLSMAVPATV